MHQCVYMMWHRDSECHRILAYFAIYNTRIIPIKSIQFTFCHSVIYAKTHKQKAKVLNNHPHNIQTFLLLHEF